MRLVAITRTGLLGEPVPSIPAAATGALATHAGLYEKVGFEPPWLGYLALMHDDCVGACGFTSPPVDGRVEIAYFTFPGYEGRGVATQMARELIALARNARPDVTIIARTVAQENASTAILRKLKFQLTGAISHPEDGEIWEWRLAE